MSFFSELEERRSHSHAAPGVDGTEMHWTTLVRADIIHHHDRQLPKVMVSSTPSVATHDTEKTV